MPNSNQGDQQSREIGETSATSETTFIKFCEEQIHVSITPNDVSVG